MTPESNIPGETKSPEGTEGEQPFMKRFEQTIADYAQAAEGGNSEEADRIAMQALMMAAEEAQRNPTPSVIAKEEAAECESQSDWAGAEAAYRRALALEEATLSFGLIAKTQMDLSKLLRLVGRLGEAWEFAGAATSSARQAKVFPVLVMALENQLRCAEARGDPEAALAAASEAVEVIEAGRVYDSMRARALVNRARSRMMSDDLERASLDLASSHELLAGPTVSKKLLGPMVALSNWWEVKSQVLEKQADIHGALEAMTKAIELTRPMEGPYARFALARALDRLGALSLQMGDSEGAERAGAEAKGIRQELRLPL